MSQAGPEPSDDTVVDEPPEAQFTDETLDEIERERDQLNESAGSDEGLPVNTDGDRDEEAQGRDSRAVIKERADELRAQTKLREEQTKAAKEQKQAATAQRGTAEQNELVKTESGSFGEVEGFKPKYKADADGDTYETIKPASPLKKWMNRN